MAEPSTTDLDAAGADHGTGSPDASRTRENCPLGDLAVQVVRESTGQPIPLALARVDTAYTISDREALPYVFALLKHEGLCLGGSSGINIAGAVRLAQQLGPGHTIVTILCDYGNRYQSKLFNPAFLKEKGLPSPAWL